MPLTARTDQIPKAAIAVLLGVVATCSQAATVRFLQTEDLAGCGLRIKLMSKSSAVPLPPPTTFTYETSGSGVKQERFEPRELWLQGQHLGRWKDDDGHVLALGKAASLLPASFPQKHVTSEMLQAAVSTPTPWTPDDLKQWLQQYLGAPVDDLQPLKQHAYRFRHLIRVDLTGSGSASPIVYAFTLNPKAAGQTRAPGDWFAIAFTPAPGTDRKKARRAVETSFLTAVTMTPRARTSTATSNRHASFQNARYVSKKPQSPEMERSRAAAAQTVANLDDWWVANTDHYVLLSDMGTRYRTMIKQLQVHLETMRTAYAKVIPPQKEISAVSVVRLFAEPDDYVAYVGPKHKWSGGMWMPMKKELIIRPIDWGKHREQRERVLTVASHEAFHQYLYYAMDQRQTSAWFNEGHAEFFEYAEVRGGRLIIEEPDRYEDSIADLVARNIHLLPQFIRLSYTQFYAGEDEVTRKANYALAWALVYYLRKGAPLEKDAPFTQILPKYVEAIGERSTPDEATKTAFTDVDMDALASSFAEFWKSRNRRSAARRNRILK